MGYVFRLKAASLTDIGRRRSNNEDFVGFFEPKDERAIWQSGSLFVVADGVGGAAKGEVASKYAVEKLLYEYYQQPEVSPSERLKNIISQIGQEIYEFGNKTGHRMATTLVAAVIWRDKLIVANVGDSRAYLIRDGNVEQITNDHNLVGEMLKEGLISEEEAFEADYKNRLTRSLGGEPHPKVDIFEVPIKQGDRVLLCSDGLSRYTRREDIATLTAKGSPDEIVARLVDFANSKGGVDNISAIFIEVGEPVEISEAAMGAAPDAAEATAVSPPPLEEGDAGSSPPPPPDLVGAHSSEGDAPMPARGSRLGKGTKLALLVAGLFVAVLAGIGFGLLVGGAFSSPYAAETQPPPAVAVATTAAPPSPTPTPLPPTATPTTAPSPTPAVTAVAATPTSTPIPTPTEPYPNTPKACFGVLGEGDSFYAVMYRFGFGGSRAMFKSSYRYPEVAYSFTLKNFPLKWANLKQVPVPQSQDDAKWKEFEQKLGVLIPGTGILIPGLGKDDCFADGGEWVPVEGLPKWAKMLITLTPLPSPTNSGG